MSAHIVNTPQNQVAYNASKAAMIQMTRTLATEWAPHNVRVNTISPGYTLTEMTQTVPEHHPGWCELIPMQRMADPAEIAGAAVYLASDASSYVTGHDLIIDGGYMCW
jgi:NAD(P)-dependent dehydrogenase (short-subunit alcohol dehydrogenase family)